jgi:hypothetical protein
MFIKGLQIIDDQGNPAEMVIIATSVTTDASGNWTLSFSSLPQAGYYKVLGGSIVPASAVAVSGGFNAALTTASGGTSPATAGVVLHVMIFGLK